MRLTQRRKQSFGTFVALLLLIAACLFLERMGYLDFLEGPESIPAAAPAAPAEGTLEVRILDVGQGDSILIRGSEKTVLIDASVADAGVTILEDLQELGVTELDLFINTHPHNDHFGGMRKVMNGVKTDAVLMAPVPADMVPTTVSYEKLITYLDENQIPTSVAVPGTVYELGGGGRLTILGPQTDFINLNSYSIVCRVDFGESSFLFTGDMESDAEKDLLERGVLLEADVLKAGHHGSSTSSSEKFLQEVDPQYVAISCGLDNDYDHPHKEALARYEEQGCIVYRTDLDGTITFVTDGTTLTATVEKDTGR